MKYTEEKKIFDVEYAQLNIDMKKLRTQQKSLIKSETQTTQKLKKLTEKELYLEEKEKKVDELDLHIKIEHKLCLKEQKKVIAHQIYCFFFLFFKID